MILQMNEIQILIKQTKNLLIRKGVVLKMYINGEKKIVIPGMKVVIAKQCKKFQLKCMEMSLIVEAFQSIRIEIKEINYDKCC